jgi:hypothetical protein
LLYKNKSPAIGGLLFLYKVAINALFICQG